ncbi:MAG: T9SS type A sorting domain-containing protein [Flavobacterium sp.]|nr:MAG: T9SS type A sorting domain-containing protein [Flavobacterium sp.]
MYYFTRYPLILLSLLSTIFSLSAQVSKQQVQNFNSKQPSRFAENKGQITDQNGNLRNDVKYIYNAPGFKAIFKANSFSYEVFTLEKKPKQISEATGKPIDDLLPEKLKQPEDVTVKTHRIDINLPGANQNPEILVEGKCTDYNNYYLAHTPEEGVQKVFSYTKLTYKNIWPKVDLVFYAKKEGELKYDIVVHPGGKLSVVKFNYNGAKKVALSNGELDILTALGKIQESIPLSYTLQDKKLVNINYSIKGNHVDFIGNYDKNKTLVIDPFLKWSTYYGGNGVDYLGEIEVDKFNNLYLTGASNSTTTLATTGAFQSTPQYRYNIFLAKFNTKGERLWATYYFGGNSDNRNCGIASDNKGNVFLFVTTSLQTSIVTSEAHQTIHGGAEDGVFVKFSSSGIRIWATYYGGNRYDEINDIHVDKAGNIYICGSTSSDDNISTKGSFQATNLNSLQSLFLAKFDTSGRRVWGTYYGSKMGANYQSGVDVDDYGNIYMIGNTESDSGIATKGSHQTSYGKGGDGFIAKFDSSGKRIWGTYYGGTYFDDINKLKVDNRGYFYIVGSTKSFNSISTQASFQPTHNYKFPDSSPNGFIVKFDTSGVRKWGTYYGTSLNLGTALYGITLDSDDNLFVAGLTSEGLKDIDSSREVKYSFGGNRVDGVLIKLSSEGKRLYGTYFGGSGNDLLYCIDIDASENIYLAGYTESPYISTPNGFQTQKGDYEDVFIARLNFGNSSAKIFSIDSLKCGLKNSKVFVQVKNYSDDVIVNSVNIGWSVNGINQISKQFTLSLRGEDTSSYIEIGSSDFKEGYNNVSVWITQTNGTNNSKIDTFKQVFNIKPLPGLITIKTKISNRDVKFNIDDSSYTSYFWKFGDGKTSTEKNPLHRYSEGGNYNYSLTYMNGSGCSRMLSGNIDIEGTGIDPKDKLDGAFVIMPNPFVDRFCVKYNIRTAASINISLIETNGNLIILLPTTNIAAGLYEEVFNTSKYRIQNGIYILKIEVNGLSTYRKIVKID